MKNSAFGYAAHLYILFRILVLYRTPEHLVHLPTPNKECEKPFIDDDCGGILKLSPNGLTARFKMLTIYNHQYQ